MMQDPKKDIKKPSVKEKIAQYSPKKKVGVGEMGKPDFKAGFEAAMQKERDFVLNRAKERDKDPDWYKKEAIMQKEKMAGRERLTRFVKDVKEDYPTPNVEEFRGWMNKQKKSAASELNRKSEIIKAMKPLKSMSKPKGKY